MKADRNELQALQAVLRFLVVLGLDIIRGSCFNLLEDLWKSSAQRGPAKGSCL